MRNVILRLVIVGVIFSLPLQSMVWGVIGHRIIGDIADSYLSSKAKKEIRKILGDESVAMSSNWMDFIKSDPSYKYMNNWHYVDLMGGSSYLQIKQQLESDTSTNVYTKLNYVIKEL